MAKKSTGYCGPSMAEQRKWQAESDLRTLREAESIKSDPGRVKRAQSMAQQEIKALSKVGGRATKRGGR